MEPRDEDVKLPSDLAGIETITYLPIPNWKVRKWPVIYRLLGFSQPRMKFLER